MKKNRLNKILGVLLAVALSLSGGFFTGLEMNVTVQAEAATQKVSAKKKTVEAGKTFKLKIKNAKGKYTWESSNSKVAKVKIKSGKSVKIVAVKAGKATITAKRGSTKFKCTVTVKKKQGSGSTVTATPTPAVTEAPTTTPEPTATEVPTATPEPTATEAPTATPEPTATEAPTSTPEPSGKGDLNGERYDPAKLSATVSLGSTYGLLSPHTREAYQKHLEYSIEDERGFIKACRDALEHGAESFTITFRGYDCDHWWNIFCEKLNNQSELSGYTANGYTASLDDRNHKITIRPQYKDAWKAIIYLRYDGYETDDDIKKLLNAAISLAQEAIDAKGNNAYDVLLYVNNRICSMTTYSSPIPTEHDCPQRDATGVFYCGDGVCESYTAAMRMILNVLGLENDTIVNKKGSHIWNRVLLDGTWYHIDVTWNDVEKLGGGFYNSYFMLTETELLSKNSSSKDPLAHSWYNLYYR